MSTADRGRIVIIDDSEVVLSSAQARLAKEGYEVVTSTQTVGSARHLRNCDLVILDFHMPGIDGGEVLASLRSAAGGAEARCMFFLYTSDADVASRYGRLGFDGAFINKGDLDSLVQQVETVFRVIRIRRLKKETAGRRPPAK
jgi:two-component system, OmpR family, response regulator